MTSLSPSSKGVAKFNSSSSLCFLAQTLCVNLIAMHLRVQIISHVSKDLSVGYCISTSYEKLWARSTLHAGYRIKRKLRNSGIMEQQGENATLCMHRVYPVYVLNYTPS